jgi:ferredoxin-NADP reductase
VTPQGAPAALRWRSALIEHIARQTPRIVSVFVRADLAAHLAGQHVDVQLTAEDGYQAQRKYSIASAPGDAIVELAIERLEGGEVSPYFHDAAQAGDSFEVRGPIGGHFIWRPDDGGPLLLIAGGSGIVPLMAIARHRAAAAPAVPALLLYSARTWEDLAFRDELLLMEEREPHFALAITTTRGAPQRPQDFASRIDSALLGAVLTRWGAVVRHAYVCGSNAFVETATSVLVAQGIAAERVRTERYGGKSY